MIRQPSFSPKYFTETMVKGLMLAQYESRRLGHNFVGTEMLLLGFLKLSEKQSLISQYFKSLELGIKEATEVVEQMIGRGANMIATSIPNTPNLKKALKLGFVYSQDANLYQTPDHTSLGLLDVTDSMFFKVLAALEINTEELRSQLIDLLKQEDFQNKHKIGIEDISRSSISRIDSSDSLSESINISAELSSDLLWICKAKCDRLTEPIEVVDSSRDSGISRALRELATRISLNSTLT